MYLEIKNLSKTFADKKVVRNLNLNLEKGKILCLLGSSGCGKTTTLKMIGGFLKGDSGQIILDNEDITRLEPEVRPVSTVFQSYALFPHMSVIENVIYGLKFKGVSKKDAIKKACKYLEMIGMLEYKDARINEISGGQQQRVALVRSMILEPKLLLLDEPLSNLDAKLRIHMRDEIKSIQRKFGSTFIFVTHDQEEAMVLGDEIAIMDQGKIIQRGNAEEIYKNPVNDFVRNFLGVSNSIRLLNGDILNLRPEEIVLDEKSGILKARVLKSDFLAFYREYFLLTENGDEIIVKTDPSKIVEDGSEIYIRIR